MQRWDQNCHLYSQPERAAETETWQKSPRKAFIQLECPGQVYRILNFEMEVMNILETKTYKLIDEEKVPVIKN